MSAPMIPEDLKDRYAKLLQKLKGSRGQKNWAHHQMPLYERIGRVEAENLILRGQDQTVYFHGTKRENVEGIQLEGFAEGTYFARHMEDAVKFGGPCVFVVNVHFESPSLDGWQVVCANAIPVKAIIDLWYVSAQDFEAENSKLKVRTFSCVFCGEQQSCLDALKNHSASCSKHPAVADLSKIAAQANRLNTELNEMRKDRDHAKDELEDLQSRLWCALGQPMNIEYVQAVKALVAERDQLRLTRLEDHQTIARLSAPVSDEEFDKAQRCQNSKMCTHKYAAGCIISARAKKIENGARIVTAQDLIEDSRGNRCELCGNYYDDRQCKGCRWNFFVDHFTPREESEDHQ